MILAEKFSQKLNNLKSRNEIQDYFVFFDESRSLALHTEDGAIGKNTNPTHYSEFSMGQYLIIWHDSKISKGIVTNTSISGFDEFISNAKKTALPIKAEVYIPERGIYPMVRVFSKSLADMIDVPEYILKLADILDELDLMVKNKKGYSEIEIREGTRYAYSSRNLDEYYPYTEFKAIKSFKNNFSWKLNSADIYSISKFQELFSFLGDIYNLLNGAKPTTPKSSEYDLVLPPHVFQSLFFDQIIKNITGDTILAGKSIFKKEDFTSRLKAFGTMSISYDPLLNLKRGTYRFTSYGFKPARQYFIKFGKLDTPILNNLNFSLLGAKSPTMEITDFGNLKIEGLKKRTFEDIKKNSTKAIYAPDAIKIHVKNKHEHAMLSSKSLSINEGKVVPITKFSTYIDLQKAISENRIELVEFIDGQLGAKISGMKLKF